MFDLVPRIVDTSCDWVAKKTHWFVGTRVGKYFLLLVLAGPLTFIPTVIEAWTAPNIDALRTSTWPMISFIVIAEFISVAHRGDWRIRLASFMWVLMMAAILMATVVR